MAKNKNIRIYKEATAIVTGGASGIGKAISQELAKRGCEVVLADLQIKTAKDVATEIRDSGGKARAVKLDVTDFKATENVVREAYERTGRLDYIFNNAGIVIGGAANHYCIDDWNKIIDVNLRGVINGTQAVYKIMIKNGFGHIVNTASMAGIMPNPLNVAYGTTKYAVVGLSQSLRIEAAHFGVRVSVICPGLIRTPIMYGGKYGAINMNIPTEKLSEMWEKLKPMAPDVFAKKVLNAVAKNKAIIIVPYFWKILWWLNRLSPVLGRAFAKKHLTKMQKEFDLL
jgi:NAD(P)-dependent dehydrogenase (short-subunit alcohol dehydrogenase family)